MALLDLDSTVSGPIASTSDHTEARRRMHGIVVRHTKTDGVHATPVRGLQLLRASRPSEPISVMYQPALCLLLSGRKRVFLEDEVAEYSTTCHLVVSQDLPVLGQVIEASSHEPYLCIHLLIDRGEVMRLTLDHGAPKEPAQAALDAARGLYTEPSSVELVDAVLRLVQLLDRPDDVGVVAPLIQREILYRLLSSPNGWRIARTVRVDSNDQRIARVIAVMRERFRDPVSIAELAEVAHLSPSALHQNFKAATSCTPLQYLKLLKLQEARRLLVSEGIDAALAGYTVGYGSPSHFSREYARMFGTPPSRDRANLLQQGFAPSR